MDYLNVILVWLTVIIGAALIFGLICRVRFLSHERGHLLEIIGYTGIFTGTAFSIERTLENGQFFALGAVFIVACSVFMLSTWRSRSRYLRELFAFLRMFFMFEIGIVVSSLLLGMSFIYFVLKVA